MDGRLYIVFVKTPKGVETYTAYARKDSFARLGYKVKHGEDPDKDKKPPSLRDGLDKYVADSFSVKGGKTYYYVIDVTDGFGPNLIIPAGTEVFRDVALKEPALKPGSEEYKEFDELTKPPQEGLWGMVKDVAIPGGMSLLGALAGGLLGMLGGGALAPTIAGRLFPLATRLPSILGAAGSYLGGLGGETLGQSIIGQEVDPSYKLQLLNALPYMKGIVLGSDVTAKGLQAYLKGLETSQRAAESVGKAAKAAEHARVYGKVSEAILENLSDKTTKEVPKRMQDWQRTQALSDQIASSANELKSTVESSTANILEAMSPRVSTETLAGPMPRYAGLAASIPASAIVGKNLFGLKFAPVDARGYPSPSTTVTLYDVPMALQRKEIKRESAFIPVAPQGKQLKYSEDLDKILQKLTGKGGNNAQGQ
jgi:hypothetical protein